MKIELRDIVFYEEKSKKVNAFKGDLYIKGKFIANVSNYGRGAGTNYTVSKGCEEQLEKARKYAKKLPMIENIPMDLDFLLDLQVDKSIKKKYVPIQRDELNKLMLNSIVYKDQNDDIFYMTFRRLNIKNVLSLESGRDTINELVTELKSKGYIILNKNL